MKTSYFGNLLEELLDSSIREQYSGYNLRRRREMIGLSLDELGQRLNISHQSISNWEKGVNRPTPENLAKLLMVFSEKWFALAISALRENQELKQRIREIQEEYEEEESFISRLR